MSTDMYVIIRCIPHVRPIIRNLSKQTLVEFHNVCVEGSSTDRAYVADVMWDLMEDSRFHLMFVVAGLPSISALLQLSTVLGADMVIYKDGIGHAAISDHPYATTTNTFKQPDVPFADLGAFTSTLLATWQKLRMTGSFV